MKHCRLAGPAGLTARIVLLGALITGCINTRSTRGVEPLWAEVEMSEFVSGETTRGDVMNKLGVPSQILSLDDGSAFFYMLENTRAQGMILLVYNQRKESTRYDRAVFFFDENEVLTDFAVSEQAP